MSPASVLASGRRATRRANWIALAVGTVVIAIAYFVYGWATATPGAMNMGAAILALAVSPLAFVVIALLSRRDEGWRRAAQATVVLVLIGAPVGLLAPIVGAAAGYGIGTAIALNPPRFDHVYRNRLLAVVAAVAYSFLLLVFLPPAGVMSGAFSPPLAVGLADEFTAWRAARAPT